MKVYNKFFALLFLIFFTLSACDNGNDPEKEKEGFDRKAMLENLGKNLIIPGYQDLSTDLDILKTAISAYTDSPSATTLSSTREKLQSAYLKWQAVSFYEIGKAEEVLLKSSLNSFPSQTLVIENNISTGNYNLDAISNINAIGFPALDYLLNSDEISDEELIELYVSDEKADNRKNYINDVAAVMEEKVTQVLNDWDANGGNYITAFIEADGTDIGSSLGQMVNALTRHYEQATRDSKIGIPLGIRSLGEPIPANVEARYSKNSIALATANLEGIQNFYLGKGDQDGLGIYENLVALDAKHEDQLLADKIKDQISTTLTKVKAIPEPYAETVVNNQTPAKDAYAELQKLLILFKTDMVSVLGILITYQDNDGD